MSSRRKSRRPSLKGSLNPSKRHRDRVNVELDNLARLLPFPPEVIAKLDKLSVLRLSASYLRTKNFFKGLKKLEKTGSNSSGSADDDIEKNGKLSDMMLEALDGFLMVLTQEGELFYASETISDYLGVSQASVIHQDFLRFVHVDDVDLFQNNLKLVPSPPEQKIRELPDEDEKPAENGVTKPAENGETSNEEPGAGKERSFVCRFKCILNTNAGFFKVRLPYLSYITFIGTNITPGLFKNPVNPFKCHGRLREMDLPDNDVPPLALFLICSPLEISTSILEIRMKSMLFCTKNKLDLTFVDIDQKGKQIVGYTKKDISAQSSYCMMHYDDIPVLKKMHQDLLATGKCEGTFRWLNKHMKWQWLTGSGQVIFKNGQPDFVITTNKPLADEEGEEEVRRREREYGIVPTSPSTMLSHLSLAGQSSPALEKNQTVRSSGPVVSCINGPDLPTTSCTSEYSPTEELPWDLDADALFDATGISLDPPHGASLADLYEIGKQDLVGELYSLDVNDVSLDVGLDRTEPLNSSSLAPCQTQDLKPTYSQHVNPPSQQQFAAPCALSPGQQRPVTNPNTTHSNGASSTYANCTFPSQANYVGNANSGSYVGHPGMTNYQNTTLSTSRPLSNVEPSFGFSNVPSGQSSLLQVQTDQPLNRTSIKTERLNSSGYYCNPGSMDQPGMSGMSRIATSGPPLSGLSPQTNTNNRYHNRLTNNGGFPAWSSAPPSPYSSASSSSSSYADALQVQFSPTEVLTSPFASPRDDNDFIHGNGPTAGPSPAQYNPASGNYRAAQRPRVQVQGGFSQPFVNIPEISPVGIVEELVPSVHHANAITTHNAGLANW